MNDRLIDILVPGLIEANARVCFGAPTIKGHRLRTEAVADWVEEVGIAATVKECQIPLRAVEAAVAFEAGRSWQRDRKRRAGMLEAAEHLWMALNK